MGPQSADVVTFVDTVSQSPVMQEMAPPLRIALMLGAFAFTTTALVSVTAFTRVIIVLSFVKRSLSTQEIPPTPVVIGLALFLTVFVMGPTLDTIQHNALVPYLNKEITGAECWTTSVNTMHTFMIRQTRKADLLMMLEISQSPHPETPEMTPLRVLIPAFMISELKTAFIMGFCIYIPFLLIDLVVSTVLMSLGMMMMPPMIISLPFKLLLFVLVDGWQLVARALSTSFG